MRPIYKKSILILLDVILFAYVIIAMTSFNKPDESKKVCSEVNIQIADENSNGFLSASEVKKILMNNRMYPLNANMTAVQPRQIEDLLRQSPFVNTAECYKTQDNHVHIVITQRLPIIRIKSANGDDYYLDDKGGIMPNSKYTSDLIIATGSISKWFSRNYIAPMANVIMGNDLWKNMFEQINVLPDHGIELVPRVGDHIVYLGAIPRSKVASKRKTLIEDFVTRKLSRLEKYYKYGLSQVGWNKYPYINIEFDNQIICKRHKAAADPLPVSAAKPQEQTQKEKPDEAATENGEKTNADAVPEPRENTKETNRDKNKEVEGSKSKPADRNKKH